MTNRIFLYISFFILLSTLSACKSLDITQEQFEPVAVSRTIAAAGVKNADSLYHFFLSHCPNQNRLKAKKIAKIYIEECAAEGINSDIAFVQMCHETNFLRYGNLVKK